MGTFDALGSALTGLLAQQRALDVASHNIANANTPGYHRQEVVLQPRMPYPPSGSLMSPSGGQFGTGVDVTGIRRVQDIFLQHQMDLIDGDVGRWDTTYTSLQQIETYMSPGQNLDLVSMLDRFYGAWQELASHPEQLSSRIAVQGEAKNLTNALHQLVNNLSFMTAEIESSIDARVAQVNSLADNLANLNKQIGMAKAEGRAPNDLLDQRDVVMSELAKLAGITSLSTDEANSVINLNGRALVQSSTAFHLQVVNGVGGQQVLWESDGQAVDIQSGEIAGLYEVRDTHIPSYVSQLDTIAEALATSINTLHSTGVTMDNVNAGDFFTGTTAGSLELADDIAADARNIAATANADAIGDGSLATEIYGLYSTPLIGNQTVNQAAQSIIGQFGYAVKTAKTNVDVNTALKEQMTSRQQEVSGVSLDEEMANILVYQRSYDAAARIITVTDQMLQTLIGLVG